MKQQQGGRRPRTTSAAAALQNLLLRTKTKSVTKETMMPTLMAPSRIFESPRLSVLEHVGSTTSLDSTAISNSFIRDHTPREDEPNLYNFPVGISPLYRTIPILVKLLIGVVSTLVSAFWTVGWKKLSTQSISSIFETRGAATKHIVLFAVRLLLTALASTVLVQDIFRAPSRISTATLVQRGWLPSTLSRFTILNSSHLKNGDELIEPYEQGPIGLHYLEFSNALSNPMKFDAMYFNHGFGASSLSWLPAIPSLVSKLNAKVGLGHDAVGFGFTDRPDATRGRRQDLVPYSAAGSAKLGLALLNKRVADNQIKTDKESSVALFGHSMGCAATMYMALGLPRETKKVVVLVAPSLVESKSSESLSVTPVIDDERTIDNRQNKAKQVQEATASVIQAQPPSIRRLVDLFVALLRRVILDAPLGYILKRVVAIPSFWKEGLKGVWGDPKLVTESDALRFQWPSIGLGWEKGLLAFTRSRIFSICSYRGGEVQLLSDVIALPNTTVILVHGTKDSVVPDSAIQKLVTRFPEIRLVLMEGQGHDPFEEDVDTFVSKMELVFSQL